MKRIISICIVVLMLCGCFVPAASAEEYALSDALKKQLYDWQTEGKNDSPAQDTFLYEDVLGINATENYRIYHVYSKDWLFADAIIFTRIGNRVVTYSCSNTGFVVCKMENEECVALYSLRQAYEEGIIDEMALDQIVDPCNTVSVSVLGDIDGDGDILVGDMLQLKNRIMEFRFADEMSTQYNSMNLYYDIDKNDQVDIGDIMAVKNVIMAN